MRKHCTFEVLGYFFTVTCYKTFFHRQTFCCELDGDVLATLRINGFDWDVYLYSSEKMFDKGLGTYDVIDLKSTDRSSTAKAIVLNHLFQLINEKQL